MKILRRLVITISLILFLFFFSSSAGAKVTKTCGDLKATFDDPLFSSSTIWYPGLSKTAQITIENTGTEAHTTVIKAESKSDSLPELSKKMFFKVSENSSDLYGAGDSKTINDFWNAGQVSLSKVDANSSEIVDYLITITFDENAGNAYQDKEISFDLIIDFDEIEENGEEDDDNGGDGIVVTVISDGDGDGDDDTADAGAGGVVDTGPIGPTLAGPGAGGPVFFPAGEVAGAEGETDETPGEEDKDLEKEVKGEEIYCPWWKYLWWLPLVIQGLLTLAYYWALEKRRDVYWYHFILPIGLAVLSQVIHNILGCECVQSSWCPRYWILNLVVLGSSSGFYLQRKENK